MFTRGESTPWATHGIMAPVELETVRRCSKSRLAPPFGLTTAAHELAPLPPRSRMPSVQWCVPCVCGLVPPHAAPPKRAGVRPPVAMMTASTTAPTSCGRAHQTHHRSVSVCDGSHPPSRAQTARQAGMQAWCIELGHMAAHMPGTLTIATHTTLCACITSARPLAEQRLPRHPKSIGCSIASLA